MSSRDYPNPNKAGGSSKTALLDAAIKLVRRRGWSATSVDQICADARVTKGAFFHHFASKDSLGVAAAQYWDEVTGAIFAGGAYHSLADPLDRVFGYVDFRASITDGPLEAITCFAGTMVQEVFVTSEPIRRAAGAAIDSHAERLVDNFTAAIALYPPRTKVTAKSLAIYTQTVVQGGFVMAKAEGNRAPLLDAIAHLKRYLILLFGKEPSQ